MTRVIIMNGPPGSGKDFIADRLVSEAGAVKFEFKEHLRQLVKLIYQLDDETHDRLYQRENKELPQACLGVLSIRQAYIHVSEDVIKPKFGADYFGRIAASKLADAALYVSPDGGFGPEVLCVADKCDRVDVIHLHADGLDYSRDSRRYVHVDHPKVTTHRVDNDFTDAPIHTILKDILLCK